MFFLKPRIISSISPSARPENADRSGLAIATIIKNEAKYIEEWAGFHLAAGVQKFIIYDNGCNDDSVDIITSALPAKTVTIIPWAQKLFDGRSGTEIHNQVLAFAHALANFGPSLRWIAFIDVDEFIVPKNGGVITDALDRLADAAHVSLPWHMFGRSGHQDAPDGGVLSNYLERMARPERGTYALNWKCIVDPVRVTAVRVHGMSIDGKPVGVNDAGVVAPHSKRASPNFFSNANLQLNHYYTRSNSELEQKISRGSNKTVAAQRHRKRVMRIVEEIESETIVDRCALDYWIARRSLV